MNRMHANATARRRDSSNAIPLDYPDADRGETQDKSAACDAAAYGF